MPTAQMIVWLMMAGLAYVLVTCVLGMLASRVKHACDRHDLLVEARRRRQAYLDKLNDDNDEGNVEIV
ncbi:MAG: hypothetical protein WDZ31_13600 [Phycisphaeraceae bacterium]